MFDDSTYTSGNSPELDIQKITDMIKTINIPKPRLFVVGVAVYPQIYKTITDSIKDTSFLLMPTITRNGFKYMNAYFIKEKFTEPYSLYEIMNETLKSNIIKSIEKFK